MADTSNQDRARRASEIAGAVGLAIDIEHSVLSMATKMDTVAAIRGAGVFLGPAGVGLSALFGYYSESWAGVVKGSVAFRNLITTNADGAHKQTKFGDDGNGTFDRSQAVDLSVAPDGTRTRVVANFNADGSVLNKTTTITISDRKTVTIQIDQDGDGNDDQSQIFVSNSDGSTSTTVKRFAVDGALLNQTITTSSADGLTKIVKLEETGNGTFNLETSEVTIIATDGVRTKTVTPRSAGGTLISRVVTVTSADGRSEMIEYDRAGNGSVAEKEVSVTATGADGSATNTVTSYNGDGSLRGKTIATTSADGLAHTLAEDLDSDGLADRTTSSVTVVAGDGSLSVLVAKRLL